MPMLKKPGFQLEKKQKASQPKKKQHKLRKQIKKGLGKALVDAAKGTWQALTYDEELEKVD